MEIRRYVSGLLKSNMYIIAEGKSAIVIDPFEDISPAESFNVERILLTHEHYDHISGVNLWKKKTGAQVFCSDICSKHIRDPKKNLSHHYKEFCELQTWMKVDIIPEENPEYMCEADEMFENELRVEWIGHEWYLFEMPGHSMGSIGIVIDGQHFFSGDSLMENYDIELRMPGGSRKMWKEVGKYRLAEIPDGVKVYPGHFDTFIKKSKW